MTTVTPALDAIDRRIVAATQGGLPLTPHPYAAIAADLGFDEAEVITRMGRMLAGGQIRRIGAVPNHYLCGMTANGMTVWDVDDAQIERLGGQVGALEFVTHCYERPRAPPLWPYNLFAMVHGANRAEVFDKTERIKALLGASCRASDILFSTEILKKTGLRIGAG
ncbi:MAG: Lrp/AsnC family transcriptional regulator [Xanthobacteraceae bacterium]|nr:MAG: Lrp/AsnC family transcriptional regulator [Xanthobacteraceae bacterium]